MSVSPHRHTGPAGFFKSIEQTSHSPPSPSGRPFALPTPEPSSPHSPRSLEKWLDQLDVPLDDAGHSQRVTERRVEMLPGRTDAKAADAAGTATSRPPTKRRCLTSAIANPQTQRPDLGLQALALTVPHLAASTPTELILPPKQAQARVYSRLREKAGVTVFWATSHPSSALHCAAPPRAFTVCVSARGAMAMRSFDFAQHIPEAVDSLRTLFAAKGWPTDFKATVACDLDLAVRKVNPTNRVLQPPEIEQLKPVLADHVKRHSESFEFISLDRRGFCLHANGKVDHVDSARPAPGGADHPRRANPATLDAARVRTRPRPPTTAIAPPAAAAARPSPIAPTSPGSLDSADEAPTSPSESWINATKLNEWYRIPHDRAESQGLVAHGLGSNESSIAAIVAINKQTQALARIDLASFRGLRELIEEQLPVLYPNAELLIAVGGKGALAQIDAFKLRPLAQDLRVNLCTVPGGTLRIAHHGRVEGGELVQLEPSAGARDALSGIAPSPGPQHPAPVRSAVPTADSLSRFALQPVILHPQSYSTSRINMPLILCMRSPEHGVGVLGVSVMHHLAQAIETLQTSLETRQWPVPKQGELIVNLDTADAHMSAYARHTKDQTASALAGMRDADQRKALLWDCIEAAAGPRHLRVIAHVDGGFTINRRDIQPAGSGSHSAAQATQMSPSGSVNHGAFDRQRCTQAVLTTQLAVAGQRPPSG